MEEATYHYLDEIEKGPFGAKGAKEILWKEGGAARRTTSSNLAKRSSVAATAATWITCPSSVRATMLPSKK